MITVRSWQVERCNWIRPTTTLVAMTVETATTTIVVVVITIVEDLDDLRPPK